jgi:hypothetical protein
MHDAHDDSENFLELLNSRTLVPELFADPPACDYLKKMEYGSSHGGGGWPDHHQFTTAAAGAGYSSMLGLSRNNRTMYMEAPWGSNNAAGATRSLSDLISFGGAPLGKAEEPAPPTSTKALAEYKKQGHDIPSPVRKIDRRLADGCFFIIPEQP